MWFPTPGVKVFLGLGSTDMRKSINSLSIMVSEHFDSDPFSGHLFAFCNRRRTILKILYWDSNGFCLWQKKLDKDKFRWPESEPEVFEISSRELRWLIEGLDVHQSQAHEELNYENVY